METINSLTGNIVKLSDKKIQIQDFIKEHIYDPIRMDYFQIPAYFKITNKICDFITMREWFLRSLMDPLTGIKLEQSDIIIYPILKLFLFVLCLSEDNDKIYFNYPKVNMKDFLKDCNIYSKEFNLFFPEEESLSPKDILGADINESNFEELILELGREASKVPIKPKIMSLENIENYNLESLDPRILNLLYNPDLENFEYIARIKNMYDIPVLQIKEIPELKDYSFCTFCQSYYSNKNLLDYLFYGCIFEDFYFVGCNFKNFIIINSIEKNLIYINCNFE